MQREDDKYFDFLVRRLVLPTLNALKNIFANMVADRFCAKFNRLFDRPAMNDTDAHRDLSIDVDLDIVFAGKVVRKLSRQLTFQMNRRRYAIKPTRLTKPHARNFVEVTNLNGAVFVRIPNGQMFQAREC